MTFPIFDSSLQQLADWFKMAFFISPMGSFQRGMQTLKNWYGGP